MHFFARMASFVDLASQTTFLVLGVGVHIDAPILLGQGSYAFKLGPGILGRRGAISIRAARGRAPPPLYSEQVLQPFALGCKWAE
jgi:hypothetical protein